ncbi:7TM chemoreceptor [Cooperia oncophora]
MTSNNQLDMKQSIHQKAYVQMRTMLTFQTTISHNFGFLYIAIGPLSEETLAQMLLTLYCVTFISSLVLVMNNFVYRYIPVVQVSKARLLYIYHSLKWAIVTYSVSVAVICNWVSNALQFARKFVIDNYGLDPRGKAFFGARIKVCYNLYTLLHTYINSLLFTIPQYILFFETFSLVTALFTVGALCAWRIDSCIRENAMSTQTKKMHRHMLIMLIVQAVCPGMLLNAPLLSIYLLFFAGIDSPIAMSYAITFLMASYSIFSPIIVLVFMKDYRNYILVTLRLRKPSEITKVTASDGKPAFTR